MGCISQNGCLGPRRRQKEVAGELVELIYAEAERAEGETGYAAIRSRVAKKGLLRKLLDHLLSHRNKAADCLTYNLRLATQARSLPRKLAGLLVVDEVTTQLSRTAKSDIDDGMTLARTGSSQARLVEEGRGGGGVASGGGADLRLDLAYFRLVVHLLEGEKERAVVWAVLGSIGGYCEGRKERFACRAEVWRTLELLLEELRAEGAEQAARCYLQLLELLREGGKEESAHEGDLLVFLRLWMREQEREPDSASNEGLLQTIYRIIRLFVGRCLSAWDAKVLFRSLFELYQDERVAVGRVVRVEEAVLGIVRESDLQAHILRGLFLYLLQFLSAAPPDRNPRGSFSEEFEAHRYPHIYDRAVRLRLFETLRRWGERGYINLDECVAFGSSFLVAAYIANLRGEREFVQEVVREFLRLSQALSPVSNRIVVGLLVEEVRGAQTEEAVRRLLLSLVREVLEGRRLLEEAGGEWSGVVVAVEAGFGRETRIELLQLMGFLVQHLSLQQLAAHEEQNPMIAAICELLHSLHEGTKTLFQGRRVREEEELLGRYQYANAVLSLLKCLASKCAYLYVLCFLAAVADRLGLESDASPLALYFDLYLIYEAMHALNPKHKLPDRIVAINFKISPSARAPDIRLEIEAFMAQTAGQQGELFPELRRKLAKDLLALQEFTMVSDGELRQMKLAFQSCFKAAKSSLSLKVDSQALELPFGDSSRNNQFKRESLNGSFYESNHERSRNDEDESFKDIVDRIIS